MAQKRPDSIENGLFLVYSTIAEIREILDEPETARFHCIRPRGSPENSISAPNSAGFGLTLLFVKAWLARPATVYREALPSLTVFVTMLGRGSSVRAAPARMYMVSRAVASLGFRV